MNVLGMRKIYRLGGMKGTQGQRSLGEKSPGRKGYCLEEFAKSRIVRNKI